jgi:hypothetical protein
MDAMYQLMATQVGAQPAAAQDPVPDAQGFRRSRTGLDPERSAPDTALVNVLGCGRTNRQQGYDEHQD